MAGSASSEYTDLALLPGAAGLLAATADARLVFLAPTPSRSDEGGAKGGGELRMTKQLVGNNDEVRRQGESREQRGLCSSLLPLIRPVVFALDYALVFTLP